MLTSWPGRRFASTISRFVGAGGFLSKDFDLFSDRLLSEMSRENLVVHTPILAIRARAYDLKVQAFKLKR